MNDPFRLDGKVALVTGGSGNLGAALTRALAAAGAAVVITYVSDRLRAERFAARLSADGYSCQAVQADISEAADVSRLPEFIHSRFEALDILVNNSGLLSISEQKVLSADEWDRIFRVNARGMFLCSQMAVREMRGHGGSIIQIASINALHPGFGGTAHYDASKGAVAAYARSLAAEVGPLGIRVNAVAPGLIFSERLSADAPELIEQYRQRAALGSVVTGEDVGQAVVYLASPASKAVTGTLLTVDGGYLLG